MSNSNAKVLEIEQGVDQLVDKIGVLSDLVKDQEGRISVLIEQLGEATRNSEELAKLNAALETKLQMDSTAVSSDEEASDRSTHNHKINELVKEINTCISLLNK